MTIVEKVRKQIESYCQENDVVLSPKEYEEMFIDIYGEYVDRLLANPPKPKRKNGLL